MLSFRNRLLILLIGLVVGAQIVTLFTALARTQSEERRRADAQLVHGAQIASQNLIYRERQLDNAVSVLAADYGLREAVATLDAPTVATVLDNHGGRIGADLTLVLTPDGEFLARGRQSPSDYSDLVASLNKVSTSGRAGATFLTGKSGTYQVFTAPVLAPDEVGQVVLGFAVDAGLAEELRKQVDVEVAFLGRTTDGYRLLAGTAALDGRGRSAWLPALQSSPTQIKLADEEFLATAMELPGANPPLMLALLKPMEEVMAPYRRMARILGAIFAISLAAAVIAGTYLGRSAARPVQLLAQGAERIAAGDYTRHVESSGGRELANLADAFNSMQTGIAERESRLKHLAMHDVATGLPNRVHILEWLGNRLRDSATGDCHVVVKCAVTNLQEISASLGFRMAGRMVAHIAHQLTEEVGEDGLVARLDGSEFALVARLDGDDEALAIAERVRMRCAEPLTTDGVMLRATVVLGVAVTPRDASTAEEVLRCAHAAAEAALAGGQPMTQFARASDDAQRRRLMLGADLPRSIQDGQLHLLYQPKQRLADGVITGVEALVRWTHPETGPVSPAEFVPIAERTGASAALTRWVLRTALEQLKRWHQQGIQITMAVNLSAADLLDQNLLQDILGVLRDVRLPSGSLTLEITESVLLHDAAAVSRNIELLRIAGVRFSIDDFGTGYSSLSQLRELAVDELKIDQSFVRRALQRTEDTAMLRAIVQMARGLGLPTVGEGVELAEQLQLLKELGCDYMQGYLLSRPATAADLESLLRASRPREIGTTPAQPQVLELRRRDS